MAKKIFTNLIVVVCCLCCFTACADKNGEKASFSGGNENETIKNTIQESEEIISLVELSNATSTPEAFEKVLANPDVKVAAYYGPHDIIFDREEHTDKNVSVRTTGKIEINSSCNALVILAADGGFTANAAVQSIILEGEGINADINSECGDVYISGKNATVHVYSDEVAQVTAVNTTAIICNHSETDLKVALANGTFATVKSGHYYRLSDNIITKGLIDAD